MNEPSNPALRRLFWLFAYPFRIFFVVGSLWAALVVILWLLAYQGALQLPLAQPAIHWHAHEMIHGVTSAMIAGFLLTALANWTGIPAIRGWALGALFGLWLAGRLTGLVSAGLPAVWVWLATPLFYLVVAGLATRDLVRARNTRNIPMPLILCLLGGASGLMVHGSLNWQWTLVQVGTGLSLYVLLLLMSVIAGRITPAFSSNWLRMHGRRFDDVRRLPALDWSALAVLVLLAVADLGGAEPLLIGVLGLAAGALHLARLWLWRGWRVAGEPLLWILHLGYLCLALSLVARGALVWFNWPLSLWYHLIGLGAMGILFVGVMTRVGLGHTGRPLRLPVLGLAIYLVMLAALIARLQTLLLPQLGYGTGLIAAGVFWMLAFVLFLVAYMPILTAPRPDGKAG
ncbi:NnrS family protein [Natronospirillum operosum]|uniref:NnrS family protein n=1 Tax=Natronospirillum operosum TaxID=2759953 RepID=A0A4Z0WEP0_9GAMM|nr:NnrS family protein [Natronospirillum operosum]TGG92786.1 NnrS family protein [Natronospirillum operosum]